MYAIRSLLTLQHFVAAIWLLACSLPSTTALHKTDTITWGGSNDRNGYQTNHNMDPAIVGSPQFGLLFKTLLPGTFVLNNQNVPEQIFAQPLVYTGSDGIQYVYLATTQNNIYKMNAKTGVIVASRNLHRPFLVSDLDGCTDINPTVGITATGVIDPASDTWYFTSKTYLDQSANGPRGKPNGRYYIHAISTSDLSERMNFPVDLEGSAARNNPNRVFGAGIHHQRPGLLQHGQFIYAGFASHCAQYNFTGWIFGWDKISGKIVEQFTTEGAGVGSSVPGGGIWMSGGGLTSDDKGSMFFATGNGYASQLSNIPVNGRNPPTALEEAAVHMAIGDDGSLRVVDFFMPWEKQQLDGADKDLGTTPLEILPSQFQCGNIKRMGVVTGKSGKTYWLDLDNLGGYQSGPNKLDNVIQVTQNENSVYAGAGVYPLEGGYIYINVIQFPTHVFKFSCNNGIASFDWVADSPEKNAYILGVGHGTTTSLDGQPGTGLLWTSDVEGSNLRIYDAVPRDSKLVLRNSFVTPGTTKFSRPVFGDGIVYQGTNLGYIYAYGSPVNLPLNCTSLQFSSTNVNQTSAPQTVQCRANTPVTINAASIAGNQNFAISGLPALPFQLAQDQILSFQAVFAPKSVGPLSSSVLLNTTQQAQGFSTSTQVQLRGTGQSQAALLQVAPNTISFNSFITGQDASGVNQSVTISNVGNSALQINSILFSTQGETGPWVTPNGTQNAKSVSAFTFYNLPATIPANQGVSVPINFNPSRSDNYAVFVQINSNGGSKVLNVLAAGSDQPKVLVEFENADGSWTQFGNNTAFAFGNVTQNTSKYRRLRVSNVGTPSAAPLSLTVSKPPFGIPGSIIGANNQVDLGEGTLIYANQNATATLFCSPPKSQFNVNPYLGNATWTMNLNDPSFGKQQLKFTCSAVSEQVGPLNAVTQQAQYRYAGCFKENDPGRQLQTQVYSSDTANTNTACISQCAAQGYIFAGTQYRAQCWCGFNRPKSLVSEDNCNFPCTGDNNQICGGNGINGGGAFLSSFGDITRWNGNSTDTPGPYVNPGALGFRSIGCYTEGSGTRALNVQPNSNNTVLGCLSACRGYKYSGVEYGGQCFCGDALGSGSVSASSSDCNMACNSNQTEYCGGPNRLNMYTSGDSSSSSSSSTALATSSSITASSSVTATSTTSSLTSTNAASTGPPTPVASAGSFRYLDCYTEGSGSRALVDKATASNSMTAEICASFCTGFTYFGTEYSSECYCGNSLQGGSIKVTDGRCSMTCPGNTATICGGPNGLSLYQYAPPNVSITTSSSLRTLTSTLTSSLTSTSSVISSLMTTPSVASTSVNTTSSASMPSSLLSSTGLSSSTSANNTTSRTSTTSSALLSTTSSSTLSIASGSIMSTTPQATSRNSTTSSSILSSSTSSTLMSTAASNSSVITSIVSSTVTSSCCASSTNTTSTNTQTTSSTSTTRSSTATSSLASLTSSSGATSSTSTSTRTSTTTVSSASSTSASTSLTAPSSSSSSTLSTTTSSRTTASSTISTLSSLSSSTRTPNPSPSTLTTLTTSTRTTTTATTNTPTATPLSPYVPLGCYAEPPQSRLLPLASTSSPSMNHTLCANFCAARSLPLFGLEYSRECYCGASIPASTLPLSRNASEASTGCNMRCGDMSVDQICGGGSRVSVYNNTLVAGPMLKAVVGGWGFKGCYVDNAGARVLGAYGFTDGKMTQEKCVAGCQGRGYGFGGVEFGEECWCADAIRDGVDVAERSDCEAMFCKGDNGEFCGGRGRVAVWGA